MRTTVSLPHSHFWSSCDNWGLQHVRRTFACKRYWFADLVARAGKDCKILYRIYASVTANGEQRTHTKANHALATFTSKFDLAKSGTPTPVVPGEMMCVVTANMHSRHDTLSNTMRSTKRQNDEGANLTIFLFFVARQVTVARGRFMRRNDATKRFSHKKRRMAVAVRHIERAQ